jgi:hypothetical protein
MRYYLNNYAAHPDYPSWYLFADDDYFVRTYKLWGILSNLNPHEPYSVAPIQNNQGGRVRAGGDRIVQRLTDFSMWFGDHNCSVPCTSGSNVSILIHIPILFCLLLSYECCFANPNHINSTVFACT